MDQPLDRPGFRGWLRLGVEAFSLLASLAFLGAVALNEHLFGKWGLSFLQIASPSDVIMTGLGALFWMTPLAVVAAIGGGLGYVSRRARRLWWGLLALECVAAVALAIAIVIEADLRQGDTALLSCTLAPVAHLLSHPRSGAVMRRRGARAALALLVIAAVLLTIDNRVGRQAQAGVTRERIHVLQPALPDCHGLVLWKGERATVVECNYPDEGHSVRVLYDAEDLVVTTARVPHANRTASVRNPPAGAN